MLEKQLITSDQISRNMVSSLEKRDVALWIGSFPDGLDRGTLLKFLGLPWKLMLSEVFDQAIFAELQAASNIDDPLTRKRGYIQVIDSDPGHIQLPERSLPIYLLGGKASDHKESRFSKQLRRLTMLDSLSRSAPRELLIVAEEVEPILADLELLWNDGFRCNVTVVSPKPDTPGTLRSWLERNEGLAVATLVSAPPADAFSQIVLQYMESYPEERHVVRMRDSRGKFHSIDVTTIDEPERPVLANYSLVEERDLHILSPEELSKEDFEDFFKDSTSSWKPYAAGLPWLRDTDMAKGLLDAYRTLRCDD